jgi:hypothetical protein
MRTSQELIRTKHDDFTRRRYLKLLPNRKISLLLDLVTQTLGGSVSNDEEVRAFFNSLPITECLKLSTAMKKQTYAFAFAAAVAAIAVPAWVSAVECTAAQIDAIENRDFTSVKNACPSFSDADEAVNPGNYDTFTNESLAKIASCKEKPCIAALTKVYDDTPDCMDHNTSAKVFYAATIKVCKAFDGGPLNKENATAIYFKAATKEWNTLKSRDSPASTTPRPLQLYRRDVHEHIDHIAASLVATAGNTSNHSQVGDECRFRRRHCCWDDDSVRSKLFVVDIERKTQMSTQKPSITNATICCTSDGKDEN